VKRAPQNAWEKSVAALSTLEQINLKPAAEFWKEVDRK
jgi:hypothetical protein